MRAFSGIKLNVMAKKNIDKKKVVEVKSEKVEIQATKKETSKKEFNGYIVIDGLSYRVTKAKADECVKRGIAKYL